MIIKYKNVYNNIYHPSGDHRNKNNPNKDLGHHKSGNVNHIDFPKQCNNKLEFELTRSKTIVQNETVTNQYIDNMHRKNKINLNFIYNDFNKYHKNYRKQNNESLENQLNFDKSHFLHNRDFRTINKDDDLFHKEKYTNSHIHNKDYFRKNLTKHSLYQINNSFDDY